MKIFPVALFLIGRMVVSVTADELETIEILLPPGSFGLSPSSSPTLDDPKPNTKTPVVSPNFFDRSFK